MRLPTKRESDHALFYVPKPVRDFADTTTLNLFRIIYKTAKVTSTPEQLETLRNEILELTAKLEESAIGNTQVLVGDESTFVKGLVVTGGASFAITVASCVAGYVLLPIAAAVVTWFAIAPFLTNRDGLAIKLRNEFDNRFSATFNNTVTRGAGFFQRMAAVNPVESFRNWMNPRIEF